MKMGRPLLERLEADGGPGVLPAGGRLVLKGLMGGAGPGGVEALLAAGLPSGSQVLRGIGVAEIAAHLQGRLSIDAAREAIVRRTRGYAKRQLTWFRADPDVRWFDVGAVSPSDIVEAACG